MTIARTAKDIANTVGMSLEEVERRISSLQERGYIYLVGHNEEGEPLYANTAFGHAAVALLSNSHKGNA